jgi:hypothetical protein
MIDLKNNTVDLDFFKRVLREIKNNQERASDIIDSFSQTQFDSKIKLFEVIDGLNITYENLNVAIFGSWYGSILIAELASKVKTITAIDLDDDTVKIAKNKFFPNHNNVDFITNDVTTTNLSRYQNCNLFINTSCEHMAPPTKWLFWAGVTEGSWFAFQSNNMEGIEGHINCVQSLSEFKKQLPPHFSVLDERENADSRGTRYTIAGTIGKLKMKSDPQ